MKKPAKFVVLTLYTTISRLFVKSSPSNLSFRYIDQILFGKSSNTAIISYFRCLFCAY